MVPGVITANGQRRTANRCSGPVAIGCNQTAFEVGATTNIEVIDTQRSARDAESAAALGPVDVHSDEPLTSKFGPLDIVTFDTSNGTPRHCLGFVRAYDDPRLQLSGWFCQGGKLGGADFIERGTLACALDRLSLLSAGSEPKVGALFAQVELNRSFCGQRDMILASTPKYKALWKALATRPDPRRLGR